jgi:hypothetical protein
MYTVRLLYTTLEHAETGGSIPVYTFIGFLDSNSDDISSYACHIPTAELHPRIFHIADYEFEHYQQLANFLRYVTHDEDYTVFDVLESVSHAQNGRFMWKNLNQ